MEDIILPFCSLVLRLFRCIFLYLFFKNYEKGICFQSKISILYAEDFVSYPDFSHFH